ncbi:MAG TPA: hypothetical protein DDW30_02730, partial [Clostridiales bacterium]|nr:hypothetical protein [Clostridiales bacterium]
LQISDPIGEFQRKRVIEKRHMQSSLLFACGCFYYITVARNVKAVISISVMLRGNTSDIGIVKHGGDVL